MGPRPAPGAQSEAAPALNAGGRWPLLTSRLCWVWCTPGCSLASGLSGHTAGFCGACCQPAPPDPFLQGCSATTPLTIYMLYFCSCNLLLEGWMTVGKSPSLCLTLKDWSVALRPAGVDCLTSILFRTNFIWHRCYLELESHPPVALASC